MMYEPPISSSATSTPGSREWCDVLLEHGEASPPAVIVALREFVYRAIQRSVGGRRECDAAFLDDVAQEAATRVLKSLSSFRGDSQFTTWATTIAVRVAFTELRHARWKDISLNQLLVHPDGSSSSRHEPVSQESSVEEVSLRAELLASLRRVMDTELSERQKLAVAAELQGMPHSQIAEQLQTNPNAIYKLLHDARKKLKQGLLAAGITESDVRTALAT